MKSIKAYLVATLAPLLFVSHAFGATILWDPTATSFNNDPTQVHNAGTTLAAVTIYGTSSSTLSLNGVTFNNYQSTSDNVDFTLYDLPQAPGATTTDYLTLLSAGSYVADGSASGVYGPTLLNLTIGHIYEIQVWTPFWGSNLYSTRFSSNPPTGANASPESPTLALGNGGTQPQFAIGTFTANASTQKFYYYGDNGYGVIGAFQVRDITGVPEPTTVALLSFGVLALVLRCRYRQSAAV